MYEAINVQCLVEYPTLQDDQMTFRYCCPICLRYFNHVLVSSCCKNYVCRHCTEVMIKKAIKEPSYEIKCAHCLTDDFELSDVKLSEKVKFYTDTPLRNMTVQRANDSILS